MVHLKVRQPAHGHGSQNKLQLEHWVSLIREIKVCTCMHVSIQMSQVTYRGQGETGHNQRQVMKVRTRMSEKAEIDIQRALKSRQ